MNYKLLFKSLSFQHYTVHVDSPLLKNVQLSIIVVDRRKEFVVVISQTDQNNNKNEKKNKRREK